MTQPTAGAPEQWHVVAAFPAEQPLPPPPPRRGTSWRGLAVVAALGLVTTAAAVTLTKAARGLPSGPRLTTSAGEVVELETGGSYSFGTVHSDGTPVRWNPCEPVHYVTNLTEAPPTAADDVAEALARLAAATGIEFVHDGETEESVSGRRSVFQPETYGERWAPVLIAWGDLRATNLPQHGTTVGIGTPSAVSRDGRRRTYVSAQVALSSSRQLEPGFDSQDGWGGLLMHELAHALGLGHAPDPGEVMYDGGLRRSGPAEWGPGDLEGLSLLGRDAGCLDQPEPGPVT